MIVNSIRVVIKKITCLVVSPSEPWMYGPVRDQMKDLAWTLEQNEKLKKALGVQGE